MVKKTRNSTKMPEKSISDKVNYYKGFTRTLRKRIDYLETRVFELETRMNKYKHLLDIECINLKKGKKIERDVRDKFNERFNPGYKDEDG